MKTEELKNTLKIEPKERYVKFSERKVPIRIDTVFKIVMGNINNKEYLQEFLEAILHRKISSILYLETEKLLGKTTINNKDMKLDLLVQFDNREIIDVEIQNENERNILDRSLAYAGGILYNDYKVRDKYSKGKKTIIWILDYDLPEKANKYHEIYTLKNEDASSEIGAFEQHFIQLPMFIRQLKEIKTEEEKWLGYISGQLNEKEKEGLYKMSRSIEEINRIVEAVMTDPEVAEELMKRERQQIDINLAKMSGFEEGEEKGKKENRIEIAKNLLKMDLPIEKIVEATGLTKEEIENIEKSM